MSNQEIIQFLRALNPGTIVTVQFDNLPPATGRFQGFQNGVALFTGIGAAPFDGFPAGTVIRIAPNRINAIAV